MRRMILGLVGVLMVCGTAAVQAQDPVVVGPDVYKVVFENEKVRVSEISFDPGESIPAHAHPDHFIYVLTPGTLAITKDGVPNVFTGAPGQVVWMAPETHSAVNTGTTEFRALVVELKPLPHASEAATP